jgi:hypothetical protein
VKFSQPLKVTLLLLGCAFFSRPAVGHDGWVEISPTIVETNQSATIALLQGDHSNEHRSYRIAGKWDQKHMTQLVIDLTCLP